ncbi:MAG TPA: UDP-N-acetylmuramate dehydrogenase [Anaerolineaceae bacterium]
MKKALAPSALTRLQQVFGSRLQENIVLANYSTARVGGKADAALVIRAADELEQAVRLLWEMDVPYYILGSGSNVLISDAGVRGVVLINHSHNIKVDIRSQPPTVWAESGAILVTVARQAALRGLTGLEWACTIPGTVGGAVYGNAGAFGGDIQHNLSLVEILHRNQGRQTWTVDQMQYAYRTSVLKQSAGDAVILAARFHLQPGDPAEIQAKMESLSAQRRAKQPMGASMGSMFKNPPGDFAGRLIEAAGLKGTRSGDAEISPVHANFFINKGKASAADIYSLVVLARQKVYEKFHINLELEIELVGDWRADKGSNNSIEAER